MSEFQPPECLNTEEASELANVLTTEQVSKYRAMADKSWQEQLTEAYADGRADEREDFRMLLQQTQCVREGWHPFTALALQAEILAALDDK